MKLYLVRHAIAEERDPKKYPDDDRPLTKIGVKRMRKAARGLATLIPEVDLMVTSPLLRARETALIIADHIAIGEVTVNPGLLPGANLDHLRSHLQKLVRSRTVMCVGHEPDLGQLASLMLHARVLSDNQITFKKGGACCMQPTADGAMQLRWHVTPRILRRLA
jgi:phosphohistidine phosphatase